MDALTTVIFNLEMIRLLKSALVVLLVCHAVCPQGTTSDLEEDFKKRCQDYPSKFAGSLLSTSNVNCDSLWRNFSLALTPQEPCGVNYDGLFDFIIQTLPKNKVLFWSSTKYIAHRLSDNGRRYVTIEDTLIGYTVDTLKWCGALDFWRNASKWFASHANGEVQVVLNASIPNRTAYRQESFFRSVEVVNLRSDLVTKVTAFVAHALDKPRVEPCGTLSLLELKADLLAKNISFECLDNPPEVLCLLCANSPSSNECKASSINCNDVPSGTSGLIQADGRMERQIALLFALATSLFVKVTSS